MNLDNNGGASYLYQNKAGICKFKALDDTPWCKFCLGSLSKGFTKDKTNFINILLDGTVYDLSVDRNTVEKTMLYLIFMTI